MMNLSAEQLEYRKSKPSVLGRGLEMLTNPVGQALSRVIPSSALKGVVKGLDRAAGAPSFVDFTHDVADLTACRAVAGRVERVAKAVSGSTGAAAGLGGVLTMGLDIPATIAVASRNIRDTGRAYGFDGEGEAERVFRLRILELAALNGRAERAERVAELEGQIAVDGGLRAAGAQDLKPIVDQAVERVSRAIAFSALRARVGMIMPVVGSVVGGLVNLSFQGDVSEAARFAYQARRLRAGA